MEVFGNCKKRLPKKCRAFLSSLLMCFVLVGQNRFSKFYRPRTSRTENLRLTSFESTYARPP